MSILDKAGVTQLQNGLNKDMTFQKQGDVTFALNGIRDSHDGGKYEYQSEPGNELVESLPTNYSFMGSINGNDNEVYIFATNNNGTGTIAIFKEGNYIEKVRAAFDWNTNFPITGEFRVKNGCERTIYWCNGDTWDGFYNFDRSELFQDNSGNWVPNKFKLVPDVVPPKIDLKSVNDSGGILPLGSYYFQAEYLDENLNSVYKTDISPQVIIYDDSFGEAYNKIDGGLNIAQYTEQIGGVPITSKSITLTFSNLDMQFAFLRINVVRQITGIQSTDAHAVAELIPINNSTIDFTYTGYDVSSGDYPLDYSEMITDNIRYDTAYVMEQVQGRLLRAGLKQGVRDYSNYQVSASQVGVQWVAKEVIANNVTELGSPKNPKTYWSAMSFQGDEIYAIGVRYLHNDGLWSPVFHVPGRQSNVFDTVLMTVVPDNQVILLATEVWLSDVEHLGLSIGDTIERWKIFNTAYLLNSNIDAHPYDYDGDMGYYETDTTYPDIRDCNNNPIWGVDYNGDAITTSNKIRHHRFPDRKLVGHVTGETTEYIVPLGIKFNQILYPNADVIGHQFCYVKRTDSNKTVLDSGWFSKQFDNGTIDISSSFGITTGMSLSPLETSISAPVSGGGPMKTGQYGRYISANILYNKNLFIKDYIKFNKVYRYDVIETSPRVNFNILGGGDINVAYVELLRTDSKDHKRENFKVLEQIYVNPRSITLSGFPINVKSNDFASADSVIQVKSELANTSDLIGVTPAGFVDNSYVYKKSQLKPYSNLFNLNYNYINLNYAVQADPNVFYNGDTIIQMSNTMRVLEQSGYFIDGIAHNRYEEQHINVELRYGGTGTANDYYKIDGDYDWLLNKIATLNANGEYEIRSLNERYPEFYAYNKDYDKQSLEIYKSVLPITYNYCSECLGEFHNKIVFSPKSFDEESFDLYRINKVNDSITIPAHRGKITGLKYQNDFLLVHTENSLFILQPNPQSLATDISTVYLTTGGFLSLPPNEIVQNDIGYAGMQSKQHMCETPNGHAWCDQKRGQIFIFNVKLEELTTENSGMTQWFKQELPSYLQNDFYQLLNYYYPNDSTYNITNDGIGIIMYYDPRFKRLIITKKDYKPINFKSDGITTNDIFYDEATNLWKLSTPAGDAVVHFNSTVAFENKSWTISYSFNTNSFTSWHSYRPGAAFSDSNNYYTIDITSNSTLSLKNIYRHKHLSNYQKYYGIKYYFIVEWLTNDLSTDDFTTIHYNGYALNWDANNKQWRTVDSTFNYGVVYNFDQSSNIFPITLVNQHTNPYANLGFSNTNKFVIKTDNNYKLSGIYDLATASPVMTSDWQFLKNFGGYIDQLSLATSHNNNKSAYELGNIKDKFVYCRLFYLPNEDYKKVITLLQTNEMRSIR